MLSLKFRYRFEAAHRFLGAASPACQTPHGHSWHGTLILEYTGDSLDSGAMAVNFAELKQPWKDLLKSTLDHSYLHNWTDPLAETLRSCQPNARCLPFPCDPTTEMIALLLFHKMERTVFTGAFAEKIKVIGVLIEETETNTVFCGRDFYQREISKLEAFTGWWDKVATDDRSIAKK